MSRRSDEDLGPSPQTSNHSAGVRPDAFRFPKLRAAATSEHYNLHIAALEWSLDSPITIRGEADIQSRRVWSEKFDPFAHQIRNLITFCRRAPVALLADDVGLGKTISAGLILSELMVRKKVSRALVVAPKLLLPQWQEELAVKFGIAADTASGAQLSGAIRRGMPVVVSTYQSIRSYLDELRRSNFDMIILDEAHKLRNLHGTAQPPQFAVGLRQALADRVFKYVLMLTATPIQNRLWDLYSLVDLLTAAKGHTNPLGSPGSFKATYIEDSRAVQIRRGKREEFRQHLSNYIVRTRRGDAKLVFPTRKVKTFRVAASHTEVRLLGLIGELLREHSLNGLSQSSIGQALMSSPQALASQLEEMASRGTVPRELAREVSSLVSADTVSGKLKGLVDLIHELSSKRPDDWRLVVFTSRSKTQEAIGRHLRSLQIPTGFIAGSRANENERAIRAFKEKQPTVRVLVSTDAGAEGINLQVANVLVNFDLPWNPMVLEQRIGRVQRLASNHAEVTILNLVLAGSVEEKVVARLGEKLQAISESLGDIEGILESAAHAGDDEDSFESLIRKLVVDSLRGVDVEQATRRAMQSIEEAKEIFEAERETVEKTLGDLRDLHRTGPRAPDISPVVPSIEARDFVLRALSRDGARVRPLEGDLLAVSMPGQNEFKLTFKESALNEDEQSGYFSGNAPRLFVPGKRDFERLTQSWADKSASFVMDRSRPTDSDIDFTIKNWLSGQDGFQLADFTTLDRREGFVGELICRASVAVAHDRLEKLITVPVRSGVFAEIEAPAESEPVSTAECDTARLGEGLRDLVSAAVDAEPDLNKFSDFYRKRLDEELQAAGDPAQQRRLSHQFVPVAAADAVGVRGVRYAILDIAAKIRIDGEGPYDTELALLPAASRSFNVIPKSEWTTCSCSGRAVPLSATGVCSVSGHRTLLHNLATSAVSSRVALRQHTVRCEATDVTLLADETELCAVTGRRVRKGLLTTSAVSGRSALASQFVKCELTDSLVLPDELTVSDISSKKFRKDQSIASSLSGRVGHVSEFVRSALPEGMIARDEAAQSDVSGTWADAKQLIRSEKPPRRAGLPSEILKSAASSRLVLLDEVERSDVSNSPALPEELELCEVTGSRCLPQELATSAISGRKYRKDQTAASALSERAGHSSEFVSSVDPPGLLATDEAEQSQAGGGWAGKGTLASSEISPYRKAFVHELVACSVSGKRVLPDEVELSAASGKPALPTELAECDFSKDRVLPSELTNSDISGKKVRSDRVVKSVHSGRVGHASEFVLSVVPAGPIALDEAARSQVSGAIAARSLLVASDAPTGRMGLPSEVVVSGASGKSYLKDEVTKSALSGALALPDELRICEFSGDKVLPDELCASEISGKVCRVDKLLTSVLSGRRGHLSEFVKSVAPTGWIAIDEASQSSVSGEWGAQSMFSPSTRPPHRLGLAHEHVVCEVTGQKLLRDEVAASAVSGRLVDDSLLIASAASGRKAIAEEMGICEVSGRRLLPTELSACSITGKRVDFGLLARSELSGVPGLESLMARCAKSGKLVLPSEATQCDITGQTVVASHTETCAVTGRQAIRELMRQCPTTKAYYIDDAISRSRIKELTGLDGLLRECPWTCHIVLSNFMESCCITGLRVERAQLNGDLELSALRKVLDGVGADSTERTQSVVEDSLQWLRSARPELKGVHEGTAIRNANGKVLVACLKAKAGLLGLSSVYFAIAAKIGNPPSLLCEPVPGKRTPSGWKRRDSDRVLKDKMG